MEAELNPAATAHLPWFITAPGASDVLLIAMAIFLIVVVIAIGNLYFQLHALPERWAHHTSPVQIQIVAVLAILALFTHNHVFWIAALLLSMVQFPDFSTPIYSIADSLSAMAGRRPPWAADPDDGPQPASDDLAIALEVTEVDDPATLIVAQDRQGAAEVPKAARSDARLDKDQRDA